MYKNKKTNEVSFNKNAKPINDYVVASFQKTLTNKLIKTSKSKKKKALNKRSKAHSKEKANSISTDQKRRLDFYDPLLQIKKKVEQSLRNTDKETLLLNSLVQKNKEVDDLKSAIKALQQKSSDDNQFLKDLLLKSLETPKMPQMMPPMYPQYLQPMTSTFAQNNQQPGFSPPPPPPPKKKAVMPPNYKPPNTGNIKKDYVNEIKQIFSGEILKPSQVLQTTKPKHIEQEIEEFNEAFDIPSIELISTAKNFINSSENMIQA